ncbi:TioE family transcriptional regulator [Glycomyces algeriensis]|uniref:MerR family transcriptional regulator n=1 Tax=Glycomyces algeriensis TaxID=256037 RepID=A0A9W6GDI3_9ACTN|nr:TioE family transcriptional regulator [Glycomyces algeriensis]MDA1366644.1 TioE family transcriptional regulator [Glycomyces algeriensis]MDR7352301.1 DNA-binding transcriptional MerR regulator [Glycomyces algeriensis]GLI45036.1 MerR family transcriptional regulator [Glycomyces algeriensis]
MDTLRPSDLAREHGLSTQAVRNYERDGFLPAAARTPSGYRVYTELHAAALRAFLALIPAYGHAEAGRIMKALNAGDQESALALIDRGHLRLVRDRETLDAVRGAIGHLTAEPAPARFHGPPLTVGELARRLDVTAATLRNWEHAGILTPEREPVTGYRLFRDEDVRDAELAHLLRRGDYPLERIAVVVGQVRTAGGTEELALALEGWGERLTERGLAMLDAAAQLSRYLQLAQ